MIPKQEEDSREDQREDVPGQRNSKCKGTEAGKSLRSSKDWKRPEWPKPLGSETGEVGRRGRARVGRPGPPLPQSILSAVGNH